MISHAVVLYVEHEYMELFWYSDTLCTVNWLFLLLKETLAVYKLHWKNRQLEQPK